MNTKAKQGVDFRWLGIPFITLLVACGSGSSDNNNPSANGGTQNTLNGSVFASAIDGASCEVIDSIGNVVSGPFMTSVDGSYSVTLPSDRLAEDLIVECSGGTFTDEATGLTNRTAGFMAAHIAGGTANAGNTIHITPSSTIVHDLITQHGKTAMEATAAFTDAFGFTPDYTTAPTDASAPAQGAEQASLLSGLRAATFSQLANDLGLLSTDQFALFSALATDLSDGILDGHATSGVVTIEGTSTELPVDIQNRFVRALVNFRNGRDASGLANSNIGILPFAKTAMTDNYKIDYLPGMHTAVNGETEFTLKISDHNDTAQTGMAVSIKPKMNMDGMVHGTAFEGTCSESATIGEYSCTVYYLMPSIMMNDRSMGFWELKVMVGGHDGEHAFFHPTVTMAMGDTAQVRLKGRNDKISSSINHDVGNGTGNDHSGDNMHAAVRTHPEDDSTNSMMNETEVRTYYLFKKSLTGMTGNHSFEFFVAAKENMMHYPAVSAGTTLNSGDLNHELSIVTMSVEVSTDAINWVTATDHDGHGHSGQWVADNISGLTDGSEAVLYVRLIVEGEQKTTDGATPNALPATDDANNHYAKFIVTPGGSGMSM